MIWYVFIKWVFVRVVIFVFSLVFLVGVIYFYVGVVIFVVNLLIVLIMVCCWLWLNIMVVSIFFLVRICVFDFIISIVLLVFVIIRFKWDCFSFFLFGFRINWLLMWFMWVVLIGLLNGSLEIVSVVEVLIIEMMLGCMFGFIEIIVVIICILLVKLLGNSGWIGWLIRWVISVLFLEGWFLCLKKLLGILFVV